MPPTSRRPRNRQPELFPRSKQSIIEIAPNHRLVQITEEIDWTELEELVQAICLSKLKSAAGRPPHLRALIGALVLRAMRYRTLRDLEDLKKLFGVSRQTLERWRSWWLETFPASRFWQSLRGRVMPGVNEATLPHSLLEQFEGSSVDGGALAGVLGLLQPISTKPWLFASAS